MKQESRKTSKNKTFAQFSGRPVKFSRRLQIWTFSNRRRIKKHIRKRFNTIKNRVCNWSFRPKTAERKLSKLRYWYVDVYQSTRLDELNNFCEDTFSRKSVWRVENTRATRSLLLDSAHFPLPRLRPLFVGLRCALRVHFRPFILFFVKNCLHKSCSARRDASIGIHQRITISILTISVPRFSVWTTYYIHDFWYYWNVFWCVFRFCVD